MTRDDREKALTLLRSIAADCDTPGPSIGHVWSQCRHCLALVELDEAGVRPMLREYLAVVADAMRDRDDRLWYSEWL